MGREGYSARDAPVLSTEDKIEIVLEGLRGRGSIAEPCRKEAVLLLVEGVDGGWQAPLGRRNHLCRTTGEIQDLRGEARALKECVSDLTLKNRLLKKHDG